MAMDPDMLDGDGGGDEGAPAWMATFSDLATLLLTFFVLLLSFAEMDVVEFKQMLGSVRDAFGVQFERKGHIEALSTTLIELNDQEARPWSPLSSRELGALRAITRFIRQRSFENEVSLQLGDQGITVRLKATAAFGTGSAELNETIKPILAQIREMAETFPQGLAIEGHSDDRPIKNGRFPSNWELSAARAGSVLRYMTREAALPVEDLKVAGYADTKPLVPNDSDDNRARNRRVEFVFKRPKPGFVDRTASKEKLDLTPESVDAEEARQLGEPVPGGADGGVADGGVPDAAAADGPAD